MSEAVMPLHPNDTGGTLMLTPPRKLGAEAVREYVERWWPQCEPLLEKALERDGWKLTPDQLLDQICSGLMGLYVVTDLSTAEVLAAAACEALEYPNANVFSIAYLGGREAHRWAHMIGLLEQEAVDLGCHVVRIPGRKGWARVFPEYREVHRVFEREVIA
jgi:hypothetical protein